MAGEMILVNRRRRGRRKARRARARRPARRRRARAAVAVRINRRRRPRRHRVNARRHHRRRRSNPRSSFRLPLLGSVNLGGIGMAAAGYIGTRYATGFAIPMLSKNWSADANTAPLVRIGVKAVVGLFLLPALARMLKQNASMVALGGGVAVATDLFETYLAPSITGITMADYETQAISDYEMQALSGNSGAYGGGAYTRTGAF